MLRCPAACRVFPDHLITRKEGFLPSFPDHQKEERGRAAGPALASPPLTTESPTTHYCTMSNIMFL